MYNNRVTPWPTTKPSALRQLLQLLQLPQLPITVGILRNCILNLICFEWNDLDNSTCLHFSITSWRMQLGVEICFLLLEYLAFSSDFFIGLKHCPYILVFTPQMALLGFFHIYIHIHPLAGKLISIGVFPWLRVDPTEVLHHKDCNCPHLYGYREWIPYSPLTWPSAKLSTVWLQPELFWGPPQTSSSLIIGIVAWHFARDLGFLKLQHPTLLNLIETD